MTAAPTWRSCLLAAAVLACTLVPGSEAAAPTRLGAGAALVAAACLAAWAWPAPARAGFRLARFWSVPLPAYLATLFAAELALAALVSSAAFERIPHVQDSIAQLFHARIVARGHVVAPSPALPQFFSQEHVILAGGRWYSQYPPGHVVVLALGVLAGAPWLVNPLLGAATVLALYLVGRELWDDRTGRLCALLGLASPFVLFMSGEFMNHASALFGTALFVFAFARALRLASPAAGLLAGLALGFVACVRPFSAAAVALPFLLYGLSRLARAPRRLAAPLLALAGGAALLLGLLFAWNAATNGSPFVFGYHVLYGRGHDPGFGRSGWGEPHTPLLGLRHSLDNLHALNQYLFEWPFPSLLFVAVLFGLRAAGTWDALLLLSGASLSAFHFFYWYQDLCFGPRFLYEANVSWLALSARGVLAAFDASAGLRDPRLRGRARRCLAALLAAGLSVAGAVHVPARWREYAAGYWGVDRRVMNAVERQRIREGLVFVASPYGAVLPENSPWLDGPLVFAVDRGRRNARLMALFPNMPAWLEQDGRIVPHPRLERRE